MWLQSPIRWLPLTCQENDELTKEWCSWPLCVKACLESHIIKHQLQDALHNERFSGFWQQWDMCLYMGAPLLYPGALVNIFWAFSINVWYQIQLICDSPHENVVPFTKKINFWEKRNCIFELTSCIPSTSWRLITKTGRKSRKQALFWYLNACVIEVRFFWLQ